MDAIKNKYEVILGFATVAISLSAFKEELAKVVFDLGFVSLDLGTYLLGLIASFSVCLYLYVIEQVARDTSIAHWKIFSLSIGLVYFLFVLTLSTPVLIALGILAVKVAALVAEGAESIKKFQIVSNITSALAAMATAIGWAYSMYLKKDKIISQDLAAFAKMEIELSTKAFIEGNYLLAVQHAYQAYIQHLTLKLHDRRRTTNLTDEQKLSEVKKLQLIDNNEVQAFENLRRLRNEFVHNPNILMNHEEISKALKGIREKIVRSW